MLHTQPQNRVQECDPRSTVDLNMLRVSAVPRLATAPQLAHGKFLRAWLCLSTRIAATKTI